MHQFLRGFADGFRSLAWWGRSPRTMAFGLIPPLIVGAISAVVFVLFLTLALQPLVDVTTGFARAWDGWAATLVRAAIGSAYAAGALFLLSALFVTLTLLVGDPFYERIWRGVEVDLRGTAPDEPYSARASISDAMRVFLRALWVSPLIWTTGLIPLVGPVVACLLGLLLIGSGLANELLGRPLTHRGMDRRQRSALRRTQPSRVLGFGVAAQLGMLVPMISILAMPTVVAGATALANDLLDAAEPMTRNGRSAS